MIFFVISLRAYKFVRRLVFVGRKMEGLCLLFVREADIL